jgi:hypothetical protein
MTDNITALIDQGTKLAEAITDDWPIVCLIEGSPSLGESGAILVPPLQTRQYNKMAIYSPEVAAHIAFASPATMLRLIAEIADLKAEVLQWEMDHTPVGLCYALEKEIGRLRKALEEVRDTCRGGFVRCENCGEQESTTDLDFMPAVLDALNANPDIGHE